ncbi:glycosyltransferase [Micromonospora sp. WMMD712]|uniref:glycosyltransferase n=1 Tax=Micromonospora sp. WMMD712 TaxID=3016096 RepID=UPI00249CF19E|nr:glycosyltransferase [Micromonospora sp. WMMD712]WFE61037.1 glycosyltransferase [Micromonospora sp. WMMD712]
MTCLAIVTEYRFVRTPDGRLWVGVGPEYDIWTRYLAAFDRVRVVARVQDVQERPPGVARVDGPGVEVWPLPYYVGAGGFLAHATRIRRSALAGTEDADVVMLRVPSPIANTISGHFDRRRRPYCLEVVGDPDAVLSRGVVDHPLRPLLRRWATAAMRRQCRLAAAAVYETGRTLQARYPARDGSPSEGISSVELPPAAFAAGPRTHDAPPGRAVLVSVGTLDQLYKGVDILIEALALLGDGAAHRLVHVGRGRYLPRLRRLAEERGVADRVEFAGWLPTPDDLRRRLDQADLFVMPSRTEGLPRALIEAMARGLPAIGSAVGGIPELLPPDCLVPPGDPAALAAALRGMLSDPRRLTEASARNLAAARAFGADVLAARRTAFYRSLRHLGAAPAARVGVSAEG